MHVNQHSAPGKDLSGAITLGGAAQALGTSNSYRQGIRLMNISAGDLWINETGGTAAVDTAGSYKVATMTSFTILTNRAASIIGATTGQKFTATEY